MISAADPPDDQHFSPMSAGWWWRRVDDLIAAGALPQGLDFARVAVEPPRDPAHGDLATNAAMVLAGRRQSKTRWRWPN